MTQAEGGEAKAPEGATTVEVWTEDRHDLEYVEKMIDQYNQNNDDNIFIDLTVITEDYKNMLALAYNGGTAPDVVGANSLPLNTFADTGILMPLNEYIDSDETFQSHMSTHMRARTQETEISTLYTAVCVPAFV